jgi:hypothetical protein
MSSALFRSTTRIENCDARFLESTSKQAGSEHQRASASRVVVENQLPQKQKGIGRTRRALRTIRDFVDRHLTTKRF